MNRVGQNWIILAKREKNETEKAQLETHFAIEIAKTAQNRHESSLEKQIASFIHF